MTVAALREKLLKEMMVKEVRKIERRIGKLLVVQAKLEDKLSITQTQLENYRIMRDEYAAEVK